MAKTIRRLAALLVLAAGFAGLTPGCLENNVTMFIRQMQAPDETSDCLVTNSPSDEAIGAGELDRVLSGGYTAFALVGSQLISRGQPSTLKHESAAIQLTEATVEVYDFEGLLVGDTLTQGITGFIDPASGSSPSYGLAPVVLMDGATMALINATGDGAIYTPAQQDVISAGVTFVARVRIKGVTLGGQDIESGGYDFPIRVCGDPEVPDHRGFCSGCTCPASADDELKTVCPGSAEVDCRALYDATTLPTLSQVCPNL